MLRATTACTFSTSQLPKVVRGWCALYILTWKCASRHNGVHFFISHLASWVRTRRFSEPTFRPSGATNHWKNTVNRDFPTFSRICIFFLLIFSLLTLLTSAFQLSILSEVSLLNFLRLPYTAKSAQSTSQYYCVLQSLHKHVPILPYTTKLAQSRSSTTVYYKACTNTFQYYRILQNSHRSLQYYCVLQSVHKLVQILSFSTKLLRGRSSTTLPL